MTSATRPRVRADLRSRYGDWALVTGASSGIGKAFALVLGRLGVNVILLSNDAAGLEATRREILAAAPGLDVRCRDVDLARLDELRAYLRTPEVQAVRIAVNCAGFGYSGHTLNSSLDQFLEMVNVDATAVMVVSHHFAGLFAGRGTAGAIVNVSTANVEALLPTPFSAVYTSLKFFVKFFTESLAYEMRPYGVDVTNVACGPTATGFQAHAGTRRLFWCETPESVAVKALDAVGRKSTVVTNPFSRVIIAAARLLPLPRSLKVRLSAAFFGKLLGKGQRMTLAPRG